jgi:hypothetical protein
VAGVVVSGAMPPPRTVGVPVTSSLKSPNEYPSTPTVAPVSVSPTFAAGVGASASSRITRSGLVSPGRSTMPPRLVRTVLPAGTTGISP